MATFVEWDVGVKNPQKRFVEGTWVEVATPCAKCQRLSLLYYYFWLSELDDKYFDVIIGSVGGILLLFVRMCKGIRFSFKAVC